MRRINPAVAGAAVALFVATAVLAAASAAGAAQVVAFPDQIKTDPVRDWLDYVAPATLFAAFVSLLLLWQQNKGVDKAQIQRRTADLHERLVDRDFTTLTARVSGFLEVKDAGEAVGKIRAWNRAEDPEAACLPRTPHLPTAPQPSRVDVNYVLSFYETVGALLDQLDVRLLIKTFGPNPAYLFATGWWYICWRRDGVLRKKEEGAVYSEFEDLVRVLFHEQKAFRKICLPAESVRLLALPLSTADDADWDLCARLSRALSGPKAPLGDILARPAGAGGPAGPIVQVIVVPPDLSFDLRAWRPLVDQAGELKNRLQAMDRIKIEEAILKLTV